MVIVFFYLIHTPPRHVLHLPHAMHRYWKASEDVIQDGTSAPQANHLQTTGTVGHMVV